MNSSQDEIEPKPILVACLGSSTTASKGTFKWIEELKRRPQNKRFHFVNLGVGGDLAYSVLQRLPSVVEINPDIVLILIGGNDVLSAVFKNLKKFFTGWKSMPGEVTSQSFHESLEAIVNRLKKETSAKIAFISLAQIGEEPDSTDPIQNELNTRIEEYNKIIKEVAEIHNCDYIPFYEELKEQIRAFPGKAFTRFSILSFYRDYLLREFLLGWSFDKIAAKNGYNFHIDGVHLNTRGGMILTNLVQKFLDIQQGMD